MVVVLIIVGIIYSFAAPNLVRYNQTKTLVHAAEKIADVLNIAKSCALTQREEYKVVIDTAGKKVFYLVNETPPPGMTEEQIHRDVICRFDTSVHVQFPEGYVIFNTDGGIKEPAGNENEPVHIVVAGYLNKKVTIAINRRTGKVTVSSVQ